MTPMKKYYRVAAETIMKNFDKRGFEGCYCETKEEALQKALSYVQSGMSVAFGGTMTANEMNLFQSLKEREDITFFDRADATNPEELREIFLKSMGVDCYFMSTNAITMDGQLVNTDGSGNRCAALIYGPRNVIIIAGMNKVASDLETAQARVKDVASPPNCIRLNRNTPCAATGKCHDCYSDDCICSHTVITRRCAIKNRIKIILVGEELGY